MDVMIIKTKKQKKTKRGEKGSWCEISLVKHTGGIIKCGMKVVVVVVKTGIVMFSYVKFKGWISVFVFGIFPFSLEVCCLKKNLFVVCCLLFLFVDLSLSLSLSLSLCRVIIVANLNTTLHKWFALTYYYYTIRYCTVIQQL